MVLVNQMGIASPEVGLGKACEIAARDLPKLGCPDLRPEWDCLLSS